MATKKEEISAALAQNNTKRVALDQEIEAKKQDLHSLNRSHEVLERELHALVQAEAAAEAEAAKAEKKSADAAGEGVTGSTVQ